ncbi:MAG: alkaline phosphatase family protein [bacterium]|nr:alkaline phosphatase family protein [bacterium]MDW8163416.1 alkaline phosphatase family protein [Candidatus Omnitrophota bacterium]
MKRIRNFFNIFLIVLFFIKFSIAFEKPISIILFGWDGVQREHLKELLEKNELPNLQKLIIEGSFVEIDITTGATDTKAGWTQILTGYNPEKTGVFSNSNYQPIPEGYSVFSRLEEFFGKNNIFTASIIGKKGNVDNDPPKKILYEEFTLKKRFKKMPKEAKIVEENGKKYVIIPGKPWFYESKKMDLFINGLGENENVYKKTIEEIDKHWKERFFFFVHFAEPDQKGHSFGENSKEYEDAIKSCDFYLGEIIKKLKELDIYQNTLIYITSDHGFDEGEKTHKNAPNVFLISNDKNISKKKGDRKDIAPTILKKFGMDLKGIKPELDGNPLF